MGALEETMRVCYVMLLALVSAGCSSSALEVHTTAPVDVYSLPARPTVIGNRKVGTLPSGLTLLVRKQVLQKDIAAYEVEFEAESGSKVRGFVLLGNGGLEVKTAKKDGER